MKLSIVKCITICLVLITASCSSVKELNHWTSDDVSTIKSKNILVIVHAKKQNIRKEYEDHLTKRLKSENIEATSSYEKFPEINPKDSISKAQVAEMKGKITKAGFNAVVYSRVIGVEEVSNTTTSGGYEAGATLNGYDNYFNIGFYNFYATPLMIPSFEGVYEPVEIDTQTVKIYILESRIYNLDLPEDKQLVASVTSKIDNIETGHNLAKNYAKTVVNGVKNK